MNIYSLFSMIATSPATGDTRDVKLPIIIAVIAVLLIVVSVALSAKPKDKK